MLARRVCICFLRVSASGQCPSRRVRPKCLFFLWFTDVRVCVCCHCLAYFAVFYVISRLTYWFQCAPSPVSCSELSKFARRRPALGGPAWLILVPTLSLVLDLVLVLVLSPFCHSDSGNTYHSILAPAALMSLQSAVWMQHYRNRHSPHASHCCNSAANWCHTPRPTACKCHNQWHLLSYISHANWPALTA